ncbi:MAG: hypothetical protein A2787_01620 [Omnitrophica WOR_2 bacterium RIFCSPHIGHO2_01_FULL_48_9]|nr:MAG: hypothetical protein A3D10_06185 [Omnitrophica WOR_2 bacterium RIFCSPHIGHO2_02_FULL_48_11]OGX34087.1 MAG: hypothetical protein A2787_01620 [Omnitrophica WOR_2 bacterium RIFCSPHIGHO2_01_FULL_48_9]
MDQIKTYEPDNSLRKGYGALIREIIAEIKDSRWLTYQLFKRDFFSMYKQSFIGILWIFIMPVMNVMVFVMLHNSGIFNFGTMSVPYPLFAISGIAFWQLFAVGITACSNSLSSAGDMIKRINFSKKSLVIAPVGRTLVSFLVQFILAGILCLRYQFVPHPSIVFVPVVVLFIVCLTLGVGFIAAILNAIVRDTGNLLTVLVTFLMYLTPVLYAKPKIGLLAGLTEFNPLHYLVSAGRDLILVGHIQEPFGFLAAAVFSVVLLFISLIIFHLTETRIAERI